jgi:uncharacterized protein with von Willebrand factor type A (vWA) domain
VPAEAPAWGPEVAVAFATVLRSAGVDVAVGRVPVYADALAAVGVDDRDAVYWAGRATLLARPEDAGTYDRAFEIFWAGRTAAVSLPDTVELVALAMDTADDEDANDGAGDSLAVDAPLVTVRYSATEVLRHKDFAAYSHDEFAEAKRLMADVRLAGALRRSRRLRPTGNPGAGARPDVRRTVRHALRAGGEPVRRAWREPGRTPRRVVLLCDVSGSMEPYARGMARFLHAAVAGRGRVEAFALGTRLTRVTRALSSRDPDRALAAAAQAVVDWGGGTRLGDGLRTFNDRWGTKGMARGAVVVILSDGWDRGDPDVLAEQMARLRRVAHKIVWVNPLKAAPGYEPLARGMAAALPYVDDFVTGHSLASLEELVKVIAS